MFSDKVGEAYRCVRKITKRDYDEVDRADGVSQRSRLETDNDRKETLQKCSEEDLEWVNKSRDQKRFVPGISDPSSWKWLHYIADVSYCSKKGEVG